MAATLDRFEGRAGDILFLGRARCTPRARFLALRAGADVRAPPSACTTRTAWAWTGRPRQLHVAQSLRRPSIAPALVSTRCARPSRTDSADGITCRAHWSPVPPLPVERFRISPEATLRRLTYDTCAIVTCVDRASHAHDSRVTLALVPLQLAWLPPRLRGTWPARHDLGHARLYSSPRPVLTRSRGRDSMRSHSRRTLGGALGQQGAAGGGWVSSGRRARLRARVWPSALRLLTKIWRE